MASLSFSDFKKLAKRGAFGDAKITTRKGGSSKVTTTTVKRSSSGKVRTTTETVDTGQVQRITQPKAVAQAQKEQPQMAEKTVTQSVTSQSSTGVRDVEANVQPSASASSQLARQATSPEQLSSQMRYFTPYKAPAGTFGERPQRSELEKSRIGNFADDFVKSLEDNGQVSQGGGGIVGGGIKFAGFILEDAPKLAIRKTKEGAEAAASLFTTTVALKNERFDVATKEQVGGTISKLSDFGGGASSKIKTVFDNPDAYAIESQKQANIFLKTSSTAEKASVFGEFIAPAAAIEGTAFAITKFQNIRVATGAKFVPAEEVFSAQVLDKGQKFPKAPTTKQAQELFSRSRVVSTASPQEISGTRVGKGGKASQAGLQDPGLYTTPVGEGSPNFLRVADDLSNEARKISLNPFESIKQSLNKPTVTNIETQGVSTLPRDVLKSPGFSKVSDFQKTASQTGKAFITKRSQIGRGEISRQTFKTPSGKVVREAGTTELEAVIPEGTVLRFNEDQTKLFTRFKGRNIQILEAKTVKSADDIIGAASKGKNPIVDVAGLKKQQSGLSSSLGAGSKPIRLPGVSALSGGSQSSTTSKFIGGISKGSSTPKPPRNPILSGSGTSQKSSSPITSVSSGISGGSGGGRSGFPGSSGTSKGGTSRGGSSRGGSSFGSSFASSLIGGSSRGGTAFDPFRYTKPSSTFTTPKQTTAPGFQAFVKRFGKFKPVGEAQSFSEAFGTGASFVAQSAARTFKLVPIGRRVKTTQKALPITAEFLRPPKRSKEPFTFIEKTGFAINTRGEIQDITKAPRRKRRKK